MSTEEKTPAPTVFPADDRFHFTSEGAQRALDGCACECCERHNTDKPTKLCVWKEKPPNNLNVDKTCPCNCRHLARVICRDTKGSIQPTGWDELWEAWRARERQWEGQHPCGEEEV